MLRISVKTKLIYVITELQTEAMRIITKFSIQVLWVNLVLESFQYHICLCIKYTDMLFSIIRPNFLEKRYVFLGNQYYVHNHICQIPIIDAQHERFMMDTFVHVLDCSTQWPYAMMF